MDPIPLYTCNLPTICPELQAKHTNFTPTNTPQESRDLECCCCYMQTDGYNNWSFFRVEALEAMGRERDKVGASPVVDVTSRNVDKYC